MKEVLVLFDDKYLRYGFIQGDGGLGRLKSQEHLGLEVNIGKDDHDLLPLFNVDESTYNDRKHYYTGENDNLRSLGFSSEQLPSRTLPLTYHDWSDIKKISFLKGLWSANGSVIKVKNKRKDGSIRLSCRISFKGTCRKLIDQLKLELENYGLHPYITTNKSKKVVFSNGEYQCKESYDLNIGRMSEMQWFIDNIGFIQKYKVDKYNYITNGGK